MILVFIVSLFLISFIGDAGSSLLSRSRYPNEFVVPNELELGELDETTLTDLLAERPELRPYLRRRRLPDTPLGDDDAPHYANDESLFRTEYEDYNNVSSQHKQIKPNVTHTTHRRTPYITRWPVHTQNVSGRPGRLLKYRYPYESNNYGYYTTGKFLNKCYWCGMNTSDIPRSPICHDAFESPDGRSRTLSRFFRAYCYFNKYNKWAMRTKKWKLHYYMRADGYIRAYYGRFIKGCYKRYLDVGKVYTQRGCRAFPLRAEFHHYTWRKVHDARSFAAHRFTKLEYALSKLKHDACAYSPHASLTPFARGISLYARYHVCICMKDYCNAQLKLMSTPPTLLLLFLTYNIIKYY